MPQLDGMTQYVINSTDYPQLDAYLAEYAAL